AMRRGCQGRGGLGRGRTDGRAMRGIRPAWTVNVSGAEAGVQLVKVITPPVAARAAATPVANIDGCRKRRRGPGRPLTGPPGRRRTCHSADVAQTLLTCDRMRGNVAAGRPRPARRQAQEASLTPLARSGIV